MAPRADAVEARPLTDVERAELRAENRVLIAAIKRRLSDRGIVGIPHHEFLTEWDGVRLKPPSYSRTGPPLKPDVRHRTEEGA